MENTEALQEKIRTHLDDLYEGKRAQNVSKETSLELPKLVDQLM